MEMNQLELQKKYQEKLDSQNDFFEDASKCDVCGSDEVVFEQRENGVVRICQGDCLRYEISLEEHNVS